MDDDHRHHHRRHHAADFADRSLGIGYAGGTSLLFALLMASLAIWYRTMGTVSADSINTPRAEIFYWMTIMFSQTLGTALGDWTADTAGLGYTGGAMIFSALLGLVAVTYYTTTISRTALFWAAFILTRPLGAVVGDFIDKPLDAGGLALSRYTASAMLLAFIALCLWLFPKKPPINPTDMFQTSPCANARSSLPCHVTRRRKSLVWSVQSVSHRHDSGATLMAASATSTRSPVHHHPYTS